MARRYGRAGTLLRWIGRGVAGLGIILAAYLVAGAIGGAIPANREWRPSAGGVTIYVETNGIHTGIIVPKVAAGIDWRPIARRGHLADPRYGGFDHLAIGWGERAFYLDTPTWGDVRPATILAAAVGSDHTLMHVEHLPRPVPGEQVRAVRLSVAEYRRLAAFIAAGFAVGGGHRPGYAGHDAFYTATGHYDAIRTCNAWTGNALRAAGVRVGMWTPFAATVMQWFPG